MQNDRTMHIVLHQPQIPHNTGAIGRLCVALGAELHLIHPLGFHLTQKEIRRAGLDYWEHLQLFEWDCVQSFWACYAPNSTHHFCSTKAQKSLYEARLIAPCFLHFGREDAGIPSEILNRYAEQCYKIPMQSTARSLNLATAVAIVGYESFRQTISRI
ncbi:MAG: tRNA (cytidine(34)-2'-O)-methyltransferase [Helicobacter sp.]|nr:tRNA (cytidine(34)-2'-O)-methyltransferase [Helicobacter sp.]